MAKELTTAAKLKLKLLREEQDDLSNELFELNNEYLRLYARLPPMMSDQRREERMKEINAETRKGRKRAREIEWEIFQLEHGEHGDRAGPNKTKWSDAELLSLLKENNEPGVTQKILADRHGISPRK